MTAFIGIDPGLDGAMACWTGTELDIADMPTVAAGAKRVVDPYRLRCILLAWAEGDSVHAIVERVSARPGQGVVSMFGFGVSYGIVLGVIAGLQIPSTPASPAKWKRALQVRGGKDGARARATELLPPHARHWPLKKHDGRAEAALLALYGERFCGTIRSAA